MLLAYVLRPGDSVRLDDLAERYLKHRCIAYREVVSKKMHSIAEAPLDEVAAYAAEDAEVSWRLSRLLAARLRTEGRLFRHDEIELPLAEVLARMEWHGVRVDGKALAEFAEELDAKIRALEEEAAKIAGPELNLHSPKQLGEYLFERKKLPGGRRTRTGQWRTDQEVLERLKDRDPIARLALEVRFLAKLRSTYAVKLAKLADPDTGRVHTSYNQATTTTGRLSSSDPNLQNIPIRTELGRRIRRAFVPEAGFMLVAADYSQIELRLMAHFSGDEALLEAFRKGLDIHAATAARIAGVPIEAVDGEMRRRAKVVNFGVLYGMGAGGLARELGISRAEAQRFIDEYFRRHPGVRRFIDATVEKAREQGFVETLLRHRV
ncbi:MAG: DNA polymerase I, partial [Zetaproteobacteria bacterium]